ncbi:UNVERIFIED_CONTAM: Aurachin C monooxygenase/isomerase [Sesamum radiatum]|uniref:Aurachin C monooxygenase/isomerase n=1 Tax=Sesamum radiatum TaxID=300843 RepID=A0AAW2KY99_SESRA
MKAEKRKGKAVVVGGSIAGLSCAHALIAAGWEVVVLEKTCSPPTGCATGAGLGLDPLAQNLIQSWLKQPGILELTTLPLTIDQNQATDGEKKTNWILTRDENFNFRAAYWSDLHRLLYSALPPEIVRWGHIFLSFSVSDDKTYVKVKSRTYQTDDIVEEVGDLLIAADGCLSSICQRFFPDLKLRYSGYCAWRGVLNCSDNENSETILALEKAFPDLGKCLYFDLGSGTHTVFYELLGKRINWIWYVNQPEPQLKGNSVTMKVSDEMIRTMHEAAEKVWLPELVKVIRETNKPFLNVIYDCEPLERFAWDNVVLIGDAAHPTTPHGLRSTNMSILDASVLGKCLEKWGVENLNSALKEYQSTRLPVTSKQVLFSRRLGRIKQGLVLPDREPFDPIIASQNDCEELQQKNMPFLHNIPSILGNNSNLSQESKHTEKQSVCTEMMKTGRKAKAVVVGGSIAGISCAHTLIAAGWDVVVLEKTCSPPNGCATGAGLGLDTVSLKLIEPWIKQSELLQKIMLPMTIEHEQATDGYKKITRTLTRDENFNFRAVHWADLHSTLYYSLPPEVVLWGHLFLSFCISDDKTSVKVRAKVLQTDETVELVGDLLVAADGCLSSIRKTFLPNLKLRYSGYCAWRGVFDYSDNEKSETTLALKIAYPDLGNCNYFDIGSEGHAILYELINQRINWIWYLNQPEPEFKGNSVTTKVSNDMIEKMYEAAEKVWIPELVKVMRETKEPFLNAIYDSEPLDQFYWDNVVLIGDAAHPISPHGARSTNMSILDAAVLGKCLEKWGVENLSSALKEYQSIRLPVASEQVLFSRRMGRIKQRLPIPDRRLFDPMTASEEESKVLQLRNIPYFSDIPSILM